MESALALPASCAGVQVELERVGLDVMVAIGRAASRVTHSPVVRDRLRDRDVCSFSVGAAANGIQAATVSLYLNGVVVPFDERATEQGGWDWLDPEQTTIQLHGQSCEAFQSNRKTSVVVAFDCEPGILI